MGMGVALQAADNPPPPGQPKRFASLLTATPDYFSAVGVTLIAGRAFTDEDRNGAPLVAILSETAARALWADPSAAIGHQLQWTLGGQQFSPTVVGVVADLRFRGIAGTEPPRQLYMAFNQRPPYGSMSLVADSTLTPKSVLPALQAAIARVDPDLPAYNAVFVRDLRARFLATERLTMWLTSAFSSVALLLCAIGLYGVLSQLVEQRVREIGIRIALGADQGRIRAGIVWAGLRVALAGVAVGAVASAGVAKAAAAVIPGLASPSVAVALSQAAVLLAVALVAAWFPARRASSVDPIVALRND